MKTVEDDLEAWSWHRRTHVEEAQSAASQFEHASFA